MFWECKAGCVDVFFHQMHLRAVSSSPRLFKLRIQRLCSWCRKTMILTRPPSRAKFNESYYHSRRFLSTVTRPSYLYTF